MTDSGLQPQAESQCFASGDGHRQPCNPDTHRWPRATTSDDRWGPLCECGNLKTDQALTCTECAIERRRAPDYWEQRTCPDCGGPKTKFKQRCRPCQNELMRGQPVVGRAQAESHPWRQRESARLAELAGRRLQQQSLLA